jgi:DNA gyrase subunit A
MLITDNGTLVRTRVSEVSVIGRNTQGVRIIRTIEGEHVVALQRIDEIAEVEVFEENEDGELVPIQVIEGEQVNTLETDIDIESESEGDAPTLNNDDTPE